MRASRRALGRLIAASSAAGTWSGGGGAGTFRALGVVGARVASSRGIVSDDLEGCRREGRRGFAADASASARAAGASGRGACWSCGSPLTGDDPFFCSACGVILPADLDAGEREPDAFVRLLGVPARFAVDPDALEAGMKRLQKILHPDKFSTRSETERAHSADQASLVNRAYAVLRDPLARQNTGVLPVIVSMAPPPRAYVGAYADSCACDGQVFCCAFGPKGVLARGNCAPSPDETASGLTACGAGGDAVRLGYMPL